jgi:hypothetical protein
MDFDLSSNTEEKAHGSGTIREQNLSKIPSLFSSDMLLRYRDLSVWRVVEVTIKVFSIVKQ